MPLYPGRQTFVQASLTAAQSISQVRRGQKEMGLAQLALDEQALTLELEQVAPRSLVTHSVRYPV